MRLRQEDRPHPAARRAGWRPPSAIAHSSENQHLGDEVDRYGERSKHYYFHLLTDERFLAVHRVVHLPQLMPVVEQLLGGPLIINNASLFAAEAGTCYRLPWHRDVIQIPQEEICEEAIYHPDRFHNNVQVNLPLHPDDTLWVVPGSHIRPNTQGEREAFQGSRHYAGIDAEMPGGIQVRIAPGQAVLYNNNIIHRGWNPSFPNPRRSLHLGYHCALFPPTWHFYLLDESRFSTEFRARMPAQLRSMIDEYFACRSRHPRMADTWAFCRSAPGRSQLS